MFQKARKYHHRGQEVEDCIMITSICLVGFVYILFNIELKAYRLKYL